jgi:hypothetical protein
MKQTLINRMAKGATLAALAVTTQLSLAASVRYDTDRALLVGSGCKNNSDSFIYESDGELQIVFTRLGFDLGDGAGHALAARNTCNIRVPVHVPPHHYPKVIVQGVDYGAYKTARSQGSIIGRTSLLGIATAAQTLVNLPYGRAIDRPDATAVSRTFANQATINSFCHPRRETDGFLSINLVTSGQIDNLNEILFVDVRGLELKVKLSHELVACP